MLQVHVKLMRNLYVNVTLFPLLRKDFKTNFSILISLKGEMRSKQLSKCYKNSHFLHNERMRKRHFKIKISHLINIQIMHVYIYMWAIIIAFLLHLLCHKVYDYLFFNFT